MNEGPAGGRSGTASLPYERPVLIYLTAPVDRLRNGGI